MSRDNRRLLWTFVGLGATIVVLAVVISAITSAVNSSLIRQQQVTNTRTLDSSERTLQLVRDCTTPGGECYERGRASTAGAVKDIGRVTVLAAACAVSLDERLDVPARADQIQNCIMSQLEQGKP